MTSGPASDFGMFDASGRLTPTGRFNQETLADEKAGARTVHNEQ